MAVRGVSPFGIAYRNAATAGYSRAGGYANPDPFLHSDSDTRTGTGPHFDSDTHTGTGPHFDSDTHTGTSPHFDSDTHSDGRSDTYANANPDGHTIAFLRRRGLFGGPGGRQLGPNGRIGSNHSHRAGPGS